jgi:hypothetical protein
MQPPAAADGALSTMIRRYHDAVEAEARSGD